MASRHAPHTQDKARSRAALGVIGVCAVLGLLTVLEVHRSHNDVHALRISKQAAGVRFDETSKESQFTRSPSFRLSTLPPVNQQTSAALTTAQQAAAGAVQAASTLGLQPGHSVGSVGKPLRAAIRSVEERIEDLIDDEKDGIDPMCHFEDHADYLGEKVVKWGHMNKKDTAGECCNSCLLEPTCNVWVYCGRTEGCGAGREHKECWLKEASPAALRASVGSAKPHIPWTSGMMVDPQELVLKTGDSSDWKRLDAIKRDPANGLVYLDVAIRGKPVGRIVIALLYRMSPLAAENFRQLCTGERGVIPEGHTGAGGRYHLKGSAFYRIVDKFIDQSGVAADSVYGGTFKDDPGGLKLKHDRPGLLSMANTGPDTNTAHFSILLAPAPHLDGKYVIFGEVVEGMGVAWEINKCAKGKTDNQAGIEEQVIILNSGQLRKPKPMPDINTLLGRVAIPVDSDSDSIDNDSSSVNNTTFASASSKARSSSGSSRRLGNEARQRLPLQLQDSQGSSDPLQQLAAARKAATAADASSRRNRAQPGADALQVRRAAVAAAGSAALLGSGGAVRRSGVGSAAAATRAGSTAASAALGSSSSSSSDTHGALSLSDTDSTAVLTDSVNVHSKSVGVGSSGTAALGSGTRGVSLGGSFKGASVGVGKAITKGSERRARAGGGLHIG